MFILHVLFISVYCAFAFAHLPLFYYFFVRFCFFIIFEIGTMNEEQIRRLLDDDSSEKELSDEEQGEENLFQGIIIQ